MRTPIVLLLVLGAAPVAAQANDDWSPKVALRDSASGDFLAPIHAMLLPDGKVMLIGYSQTVEEPPDGSFRTGSFTAVLDPPLLGAGVPTEVFLPLSPEDVEYDLTGGGGTYLNDTYFCSGHAHLEDGNVLLAGGLRVANSWFDPALGTTLIGGGGLPYAAIWENASQLWIRTVDMVGQGTAGAVGTYFEGPERYYPTVTRLSDGRMLVMGGSQILELSVVGQTYISNEKNLSAEIWDPVSGSWSLRSAHAATPPVIFNRDYTHTFLMPVPQGGFDVLVLGEAGRPVQMASLGAPVWSAVGPKRPGPDMNVDGVAPVAGGSTCMLPIRLEDGEWGYGNGTLFVAGGDGDYHDEVDLYDPNAGAWGAELSLAVDRHDPATVLLPNGEVLTVCGFEETAPEDLLRRAEYFDPATGFTRETGGDLSYAVRGYHTVSVLLPDGRVLIGGGRAGGVNTTPLEKANFELLSPPYVFGNRPELLYAPDVLEYRQPFRLTWNGNVGGVVLVALGSMTHAIDMGQRHVELILSPPRAFQFPPGSGSGGTAWAPIDTHVAPPGYYILFLLAADAERTPSIGKIVRLQ